MLQASRTQAGACANFTTVNCDNRFDAKFANKMKYESNLSFCCSCGTSSSTRLPRRVPGFVFFYRSTISMYMCVSVYSSTRLLMSTIQIK